MKAAFYTLGCKVNQYDTQTMVEHFSSAGHEIIPFDAQQSADCYIINTCTVTAMSDKKSRQIIARAHAKHPEAIICVTGCFAQRDAEAALALPGVRLVLGNQLRGQIVEQVEALYHGKNNEKINAVQNFVRNGGFEGFEDLPAHCEGRTRAIIKIQEGCNCFCSYCIIPYARGPSRSRSLEGIIREAQRLGEQGFLEFVLTGIHLASYRGENGESLADVIQALAALPGVQRIRLGSLDPDILTEAFVEICAKTPKVCRHFHVSMQSGSDSVLKRMNRRYSASEYASRIQTVRQAIPTAAITTDVIAGFPQESHAEHEETMNFIQKIAFAKIHVFPYSARKGTPAARLPQQIPKVIKDARAHELIALGKSLTHDYLDAMLNSEQDVLLEKHLLLNTGEEYISGYTDRYIQVAIPQNGVQTGQICRVRLITRQDEYILGAFAP